ncbi:MAG: DoxX family protein [Propionibacteriaceae bacterium]
MSLLRFAGRSMLASFFVVQGAKAVMNPEPLVADAEPLAKAFVPLAQKVAPASVAAYVPEDTRTLVRLTGVAQVVGGLMLATGLGRRLGAGILGLSMVPHVLASRPSKTSTLQEREIARSHLLRNVALLGGAILASQDTQGRPSFAWLADDRRQRLATDAGRTAKQLTGTAKRAGKGVVKEAKRTGRGVAKEARRAAERAAKDAQHAKKAVTRDLKVAGSGALSQVAGAQRRLEHALS